ncbi:hypothetical protein DEO72_LG11g2208 [Vigna unguiculata]|uniref:Uncharacterized protein n=1 Tax=Vigna unguiculata TaxID=3917 RepID=A0A4D6NRU2_VIGUN|nr:hypothetical protein DEO72_LG11g2208 [Vigna unguiculata]
MSASWWSLLQWLLVRKDDGGFKLAVQIHGVGRCCRSVVESCWPAARLAVRVAAAMMMEGDDEN